MGWESGLSDCLHSKTKHMKQVLVKKGSITIEEVPPPAIAPGEVMVRTHVSLISTGTELSGLAQSKQSLLTRALNQPHNVKKVMKMAREKGFIKTYKIVKGLLDFGTPTGYSLAGTVLEVGSEVKDLYAGDRVACSGAGIANHAEVVSVPRLLTCRVPKNVPFEDASSVTLGAIAMQGVRQAQPQFGETIAVIGLGLLGQLTVQLLKVAGCRVIGVDPDVARLRLARQSGADFACAPELFKECVTNSTEGYGVDACIITAATESDEPMRASIEATRKRGRVVVVGAVGLHLDRSPWYEKEIDLRISCSYGPGRYDDTYEHEGIDYPLPYVRWTENRNMEEYLRLLAEGKVRFSVLDAQKFPVEEANRAYAFLKEQRPLAALLTYGAGAPEKKTAVAVSTYARLAHDKRIHIGLIGAGSFATTTHLPNMEKLSRLYKLHAVASRHGTSAKQFALRYDAAYCTTKYEEVLADRDIDAVLIATRHNLHARLALEGLRAGKHVFLEKPLALTREELEQMKNFYTTPSATPLPILFVGFNRRFSPFVQKIKECVSERTNPLQILYRVNAGYLPPMHWTQRLEGGGRIIGEGCHFLDVFRFLVGAPFASVNSLNITPRTQNVLGQDNVSATLKHSDGSVATLLYTALGHRDLPKEYMEVYCDGKVYILDDYKSLSVKGGKGDMRGMTPDKGHSRELQAFAEGIRSGAAPISLEELFDVTEASFRIMEAL